MTFQRSIQILCLFLFLLLLLLAISSATLSQSVHFFLRLDPSAMLAAALSGRALLLVWLPALMVLAVSLILGRVFCGHICPMGTTIDGADHLLRSFKGGGTHPEKLRTMKYWVLAFLVGAALMGVSFIFVASPLSLITRLYGLLLYPLLSLCADLLLGITRPVLEWMDISILDFTQIQTPHFATQLFILIFFLGIFMLVRMSPRFWCRYVCPSGALLAICSIKPLIRRRVGETCTECGTCVHACPMSAIPDPDPYQTRHNECIVCLKCQNTCPEEAITFDFQMGLSGDSTEISLPSRRQFLAAGMTGVGTAAIHLTGLDSLYGRQGSPSALEIIRPPAALPETAFLARCIRCGECMAACPTNTLQPLWFKAGTMGLFSPAITPRQGPCNPECHRCSDVCPTRAISLLDGGERIYAKTGTAIIFRQKCLAWEQNKNCMVCDEVCPFDAIDFMEEKGNPVPVPHVMEAQCAGCGYCEYYCPVQGQAAIVVSPTGALRLDDPSYREEGRRQGLRISLRPGIDVSQPLPKKLQNESGLDQDGEISKGFAPGFTD